MKAFFNLVRWQNLIMIIITMTLMRYAVIEPVLNKINIVLTEGNTGEIPMSLKFPWYDFIILVAATILITAGGYVINDYFDIKTDLINKGEVIVGTKIPRRLAMTWHNILNITGVAAGFYISWKAGFGWMGILFLLVSGLLYFYSASYKRQFLIGNIIVAILVAMVPFLVVLYEWPALYKFYETKTIAPPPMKIIFYWVGGFALFAFLSTLSREIIKDIEDFDGDKAYGRNTVPIVMGPFTARIISICLIVIIITLLYLTWYFILYDNITLIYISLAIVFPLLLVIYLLVVTQGKKQLHNASRLMKIVMITGILYSVIVKVILTWNLI